MWNHTDGVKGRYVETCYFYYGEKLHQKIAKWLDIIESFLPSAPLEEEL